MCGIVSPDDAQICDCGYSYTTGMLRRGSSEVDRGFRRSEDGQPYRFGWFTAVSYLVGAANPDLLEVNGVALGAAHACGFLVAGFAAAVVRAWGWFVLLASQAVLLVYGGYYMAFVSQQWTDRVFVAVAAVTMSALQFVYFYKRRAMFGARWRWGRLERWCPRLVGPETVDPVRAPGFAGLSHARRLLFVLVVLAGIAFELLSWGTPRPRTPADQDDEEGRLVTFYVG